MNWLIVGLLLSAVSIWTAVITLPDSNLKVIVCDVGQGDGILIIKGATQMVVDAGPGKKILDCLAKYMPFYDQQIELAVITHPQQDHYGGFLAIVDRYNVKQVVSDGFDSDSKSWGELKTKIKNIPYQTLAAGDTLLIGKDVSYKVIWPTSSYVSSVDNKHLDLNVVALVGTLSYRSFDMLLTADADSQVELAQMATGLITDIEVLKVPHHGSKTGMLAEWLEVIKPELAVVSAGKNNSYGHPHPIALGLLENQHIKTLRTDLNGNVEIISDGQKWWYNLQYEP